MWPGAIPCGGLHHTESVRSPCPTGAGTRLLTFPQSAPKPPTTRVPALTLRSTEATPNRDPVEVLAEEFLQRRRRGENVAISDYVDRYPAQATRIQALFPTLLLLEGIDGAGGPAAPPVALGEYRIEAELGRGGMGMVYLAIDTRLDRRVALKLLPDEFAQNARRRAMFDREARTAAHLNHPNIATVYELGARDDRHFIAMEYVEGRTLRDVLRDGAPLQLPEILDLAAQIATGLAAAHEHQIIHRDLKPANMVVTPDRRVKILDFGLAKALQRPADGHSGLEHRVGSTGVLMGTPGYMSPEQARGQDVDARTDLFALGVVLYEMATGQAPFERETTADTISALLNEEPRPAAELNPQLPPALVTLIAKLLEKQAADRYRSAGHVVADLREMVPHSGASRPRRALAAASIVLAGVAAVWVFASKPWQTDSRFEEVRDLLFEGKLLRANTLLGAIERDGIVPPSGLQTNLVTSADEALRASLDQLAAMLAGAADEGSVRSELGSISELDPLDGTDGDDRDDADELCERAAELTNAVATQAQALTTRIETGRLDHQALAQVRGEVEDLANWEFEAIPLAVASRAADRLRLTLARALFDRGMLPASPASELTRIIALLDDLPPTGLPPGWRGQLITRGVALNKTARIAHLTAIAEQATTLGGLDRVRDELLVYGKAAAERILPRYTLLCTEQAVAEFQAGRREELDKVDDNAQSRVATATLDWIRTARNWLRDLHEPQWTAITAPAAAEARAQELTVRSHTLDRRLRAAAAEHLRRLAVTIEAAHAAEFGWRLVQDADRQLSLRQAEAAADLICLAKTIVVGVPLNLEELHRELDVLRSQLRQADATRKRYQEFLTLLQPDTLDQARVLLSRLEADWQTELGRLDQAIAFAMEPGQPAATARLTAGLRLDRARLHLMLGAFAEALAAAEADLNREPTVERLLLCGTAAFALENSERALGFFERAVARATTSNHADLGVANFWRGACRTRLEHPEALADLDAATRHSFSSASLHLARAKLTSPIEAIEAANQALAHRVTEEDVFGILRGNRDAASRDGFDMLSFSAHLRKAAEYLETNDFDAALVCCLEGLQLKELSPYANLTHAIINFKMMAKATDLDQRRNHRKAGLDACSKVKEHSRPADELWRRADELEVQHGA